MMKFGEGTLDAFTSGTIPELSITEDLWRKKPINVWG
jgi:hypothetical protein